jgi:bifunctional DNase/RNase
MEADKEMLDVSLRGVHWNEEQGHPVLVLGTEGRRGTVSIALSPADAQLLAASSPAAATGRLRSIGLVEDLLRAMNGRLQDVVLTLDASMVLVADLWIETGGQCVVLSAQLTDAILLAARAGVPLRISELDLRWIRAVHSGQDPAPPAPSFESPLTRAMNSFIESLPLDDFTGPPPPEPSDQPFQASE